MIKAVFCVPAIMLGLAASLLLTSFQQSPEGAQDIIRVPINLEGGHPSVQVWFEGQNEPFNMVLDTGSSRTVVFASAAERIPSYNADEEFVQLDTFLGQRSLPVGPAIRVRVDDLSPHARLVAPLYYLSAAEMPEFDGYINQYDGILGMDAFAGAFIGLEWNSSSTLHVAYMVDPLEPHVPILPPVSVRINSQDVACLADTGMGARPGLIVRATAPGASEIISTEARSLVRPSSLTPTISVRRVMADVELSGVEHAMIVDVEVARASQGLPRGPTCILGRSAMASMQLTLDLVRSVSFARHLRGPDLSYNRAGISGVGFDTGSGEVVVAGIDPGSAAEEVGILVGDEIIAVNGLPLSLTGLTALREALYAPAGTESVFKIRRAGEDFDVAISLREMLN